MPRLLVSSSEFPPGPGGIGTHAHQLASSLQRSSWEVLVVTAQDYASAQEAEAFNRSQPFEIVPFPARTHALGKAVSRWRILSHALERWKPDVAIASGDRIVLLTAGITRTHRLPWVAIEHGRFPEGPALRLKKWALDRASAVVSVSEYVSRRLAEVGIRPSTGEVIPNGADPTVFQVLSEREVHEFRKRLRLDPGERLLLTVGHLSLRKGQDIVIRALPRILQETRRVQYLMVGLPACRGELTRLAESLGVADRVHFFGRVDSHSLVRFLNSCDVFVMTSRHATDGTVEGYGIAVVEAALCGKPAVVSRNSGLAEAISEGVTGLSVPEDDPRAVAEAILRLFKDEDARTRMGASARERALREQVWSRRGARYDRLLRSLLHSSSC